ncbi:MAG: glycoside hydrolase family 2 protein, partial [Bacteroidales bacterium]|nr:glycoside hydrolase family 2 protein [Bacteroidales bacterium]
MKRILLTLLTLALGLNLYAQISFGESTIFNDGWKFKLGDDTAAVASDYDDSKWQNVSLPHDWSVKGTLSPDLASCTGYLPAGIAWYRKTFDGNQFSAEQVYIYFEGVYNRSTVYLNGHELGHRPNGYISFAYDLTPYLNREGENVLAVRVDHSRIADSRWYTGSGIYRDVYVVEAGKVHFSQWGVGYQLSSIDDKKAVISVDAAIDGLDSNKYKVNLILKDAKGAVVARTSTAAKQEQTLSLTLKNPKRWSLSDPYLYSLEAQIVAGKEVVDATTIPVGLRTLQFDADKGFSLNGSWIKVKGVCLHHDAGVLGAAVPEDVWLRRLQNLKSIGVNAIRTSHNPQAPVFYDICDRIGLLVMDEAFDEWEFAKRKWVEGWNVGTPAFDGTFDFFEEWAETDVRDMVRRDRNHPSIFLWSIGNEVDYPNDPYSHPILDGGNSDFTQKAHGGYNPDAPNAMRIGEIAKRLAAVVRDVDASRPVTGALAGVAMSNQTAYPEAVDVVGYNYTESRYISDHKTYPNRVIYGSENRSDYSAWTAVRDNEHIFGQFIWTGTDYLGESNAWPSRGFYSGMLDLGSYPKPSGYFRASLWSETPMCY